MKRGAPVKSSDPWFELIRVNSPYAKARVTSQEWRALSADLLRDRHVYHPARSCSLLEGEGR